MSDDSAIETEPTIASTIHRLQTLSQIPRITISSLQEFQEQHQHLPVYRLPYDDEDTVHLHRGPILSETISFPPGFITKLTPQQFRDTLHILSDKDNGQLANEHFDEILNYFELLIHDPVARGNEFGISAYDEPRDHPRRILFLNDIGDTVGGIIYLLSHDTNLRMDPKHIERLLKFSQGSHRTYPKWGIEYIPDLLVLDERNGDRSIHARELVVHNLKEVIKHCPANQQFIIDHIKHVCMLEHRHVALCNDILLGSLVELESEDQIRLIFKIFRKLESDEWASVRLLRYAVKTEWSEAQIARLEHILKLPPLPDYILNHLDDYDVPEEDQIINDSGKPFERPDEPIRIATMRQLTDISNRISYRTAGQQILLSEVVDIDEHLFDHLTVDQFVELMRVFTVTDNGVLFVKYFDHISRYYEQFNQIRPAENDEIAFRNDFNMTDCFKAMLIQAAENASITIPSSFRERIYQWSDSHIELLKEHGIDFIPSLILLDNAEPHDRIDAANRFTVALEQKLANIHHEDVRYIQELLGAIFTLENDYSLYEWTQPMYDTVCRVLGGLDNQASMHNLFVQFANAVSLEEARRHIRQYSRREQWDQAKLGRILGVIDETSDYFYDWLWNLYKKVIFGADHPPNVELQPYEETLLKKEFINARKILDIGCGDGRLLVPLNQAGARIVGIDGMAEHVQRVREQDANTEVYQMSWHRTGFPDKEFTAMYCLGRSFLHNLTPNAAIHMLCEMNRIQPVGGVLIMDTPHPDFGEYKHEREKIDRRAEQVGIYNKRRGFIIDGPKPGHTFDRMVPMPEELMGWAYRSGYRGEIISEQWYGSEEPYGRNKNIYWRLTKVHDVKVPAIYKDEE